MLVSQAARDLAVDQLGAQIELRDLGVHRLKDLARPEHVWQVVTPDLPAEFPPLKSLDAVPNNLPLELSNFVEAEIERNPLLEHSAGDAGPASAEAMPTSPDQAPSGDAEPAGSDAMPAEWISDAPGQLRSCTQRNILYFCPAAAISMAWLWPLQAFRAMPL